MVSAKKRSISGAAVLAATGKDWQGWFGVLDAAGANTMDHTQMAAYLSRQQGIPAWWSQMVPSRPNG